MQILSAMNLQVYQSRVGEAGQVAPANFPLHFFLSRAVIIGKTYKSLWPRLCTWENFTLAYRKCRKRKRYKHSATDFDFDWERNLALLVSEVRRHTWLPGKFHHFPIQDPKPRWISAAPFRDPIVHHAMVNILEPIFEPRFIFDSYACRKGKGTHRAVRRAQMYMRRYPYFLKTDIVKFFPSIDHDLLFASIARRIRDHHVLSLIRKVIDSGSEVPIMQSEDSHWFPQDDLFAILRTRGLPIGNLTSQFFANVYLDSIDHWAKEVARIPGYIRYADDMILFGSNKSELWNWAEQLGERLQALRLRLHPNKTQVGTSANGVLFMGNRVFPHQRRLAQASLKRIRRKIRLWKWQAAHGELDVDQVQRSLDAWIAHSKHCNATGVRNDVLQNLTIGTGKRSSR